MVVSVSGVFGVEISLLGFLDCWNMSRTWCLLIRRTKSRATSC